MPLTVADINTSVQFMMNDTSASLYTAAVILPALKIANDDLQAELLDNDIRYLDEEASEQDIAIGGLVLTTVPSDMVEPIEIHERATTDVLLADYRLMERRNPLPDLPQAETLRFWEWREQTVNFLGATVARGIRLRYRKLITPLTGDASTIAMQHAKNYLSYQTAGHIKAHIEENMPAAETSYNLAANALDKLIGKAVKGMQADGPIRRRRYSEKFVRIR